MERNGEYGMLKAELSSACARVEEALQAYLVTKDEDLAPLLESERYTVLAGGKRIRPFLVLAFCRLFGGDEAAALPYACAVELIHSYSLIHDDLPCMDNDDLRRGRPTNHVVFGEAPALLAGDALLTYAFEVAAENRAVSPELGLEAVRRLAHAAGSYGMVGGQTLDLRGENEAFSRTMLEKLHRMKTGALIRVSAELGCLAAGLGAEDRRMTAARRYAEKIGLAFQVVDDLLDATSDAATLGKSVGGDADLHKTTFLTFLSPDEARAYAGHLTQEAVEALDGFAGSALLEDLAWYLAERSV